MGGRPRACRGNWRVARTRAPWRAPTSSPSPRGALLGDDGCDRLLACMRPIVARLVEHEAVAFPNPMGLPAPTA